jgi:hypothetical protein
VALLELVPFALDCPNELLFVYNFHASGIAPFGTLTAKYVHVLTYYI